MGESGKRGKQGGARFLVFEGLDGSGKSTLIQALLQDLRARSLSVVTTREPGGTPLAEEIRRLLLRTDGETPVAATELLLYAASRAQHTAGVILPALARGDWVLCDRYDASSVAFQCFGRQLPRAQIDWLNTFAKQGATADLTILLDVPVTESRRRQEGRDAADRMESEKAHFHEAVREGYLAQAKENPDTWLTLDAMSDPASLLQRVQAELKRRKWLD